MCAFSDFESSPYDHIIEELSSVTSSEFVGRLRVRPRDVEGGVWPVGLDAKIELHGPDGFSEVLKVADDGAFGRNGLRPGRYCFKISASGFRSMLGTAVIDRTMRRTSPLEIELIITE
jgi:hypothetical protein